MRTFPIHLNLQRLSFNLDRFAFGTSQQMLFMKRLGMYLRSGIPISRALSYMEDDAHSSFERRLFSSLKETVEHGRPLSQGLAAFPHQFNRYTTGFIEAGESTGKLAETLEKLALSLAKRKALRGKLLTALTYPAIILVCTISITLFLTLVIFPKIIPILRGFKTQLPFTTRALIGINSFITKDWLYLGGICIILSIFCLYALRMARVQIFCESVLLRVPFLGSFYQSYGTALFSRTLALQLSSGIGILPSLSLVGSVMPGIIYKQALKRIDSAVSGGTSLSSALRVHPRLFLLLLSQMVSAGEVTGSVSSNLAAVADFSEEQLDTYIRTSTTLIEPVLMVVMGLLVGFVALAIITPIYSLTQNLSTV